jgi:hypothetical protein
VEEFLTHLHTGRTELIRVVLLTTLRRTQVKTLLATIQALLRLFINMEILFIGLLLGYLFAALSPGKEHRSPLARRLGGPRAGMDDV